MEKKTTNGDRIRQMSNEEIAKMMDYYMCCPHDDRTILRCSNNCRECWIGWLNKEMEK